MRLEGVLVATITPFKADGSLCTRSLEKHLSWLADRGVHGFVPCGTTGEGTVLSTEERRTVLEITRDIGKARGIRLVAGCGSNHTETTLDLMNEAEKLGYEAALVVTPYYNKPTPAGCIAHYQFLATHSKLPIVLYNIPGRTGVQLSVDTIATLLTSPQIIGLKEATGQYAQWLALAHDLDWSNRALLAGDDDSLAPMLALGGSGIISASANVYPDGFVELYRLAKQGKWAEAFQWQRRLQPFTRAMFIETNPAPAKFALTQMGRIENVLRLPLVPVTPGSEKLLRSVLGDLEVISKGAE